jgi:UDP-2,3-diacylglucosamine pyrophosphatase LpxH
VPTALDLDPSLTIPMRIYCVSDLHIQHRDEPFLFTKEKERVFVAMAAEALARDATLLLAGDIFDFTGMTPPARGLEDFFKRVGGKPRQEAPRDVDAQLGALRDHFPLLFDSLTALAKQKRLWVIPGNHDCAIGMPAGKQALLDVLGVASDAVELQRTFRAGDFLFTAHGNEYDESNRTDRGCRNRGSVITAALYNAVKPALVAMGVPTSVADAIPAVRPEENIVDGLEFYLGAAKARSFLVAFAELLRVNGYFTGFAEVKIWVATHLLRCLVEPQRVRSMLADDTNLKEITSRHADAILTNEEPTVPAGPRPGVVVMGHTHELDGDKSYVNLGTWIDHVSGLAEVDLAKPDRTLPVLVVEEQDAALHDCQGMVGAVTDCRVLWRRGVGCT